MTAPNDPILTALESAIWAFIRVRRRYPLLMDTAAELERVRARFKNEFHNDGLIQIMRDSFDMLVIDLFSIRESLVEGGGLLDLIRKRPTSLRRRAPEEFTPGPIATGGLSEEERERLLPELQREIQERYARDVNDAIGRLVGPDPPTAEHVTALIKRFRTETEPLDRDRNRVRAHRFERGSHDTTHLFIPLPDLAGQIEVVQEMLADLYLALTCGRFHMETTFAFDPEGTAQSLADLLVHGTINRATLAYGLAPKEGSKQDPAPWYWAKRGHRLGTQEQ